MQREYFERLLVSNEEFNKKLISRSRKRNPASAIASSRPPLHRVFQTWPNFEKLTKQHDHH